MKFADKLIGKGLSFWIITKLIAYNLAWMLVLVVPMSVLVATLMAFGNMSQNNEVAVMKSAGISLYRMILAPFLIAAGLFYLLVLFNNYVYPEANHQARILMMDIRNQKPTFSLVPGVFNSDVPNFSILAREVDPVTNSMTGVTIYDFSRAAKKNVVTAEKGRIYFSKNHSKLMMDLQNGEIHESEVTDENVYRKLTFKAHKIAMNGEEFSFKQTAAGLEKSDRELGADDLALIADSLEIIDNKLRSAFRKKIDKSFFADSQYFYPNPINIKNPDSYFILKADERLYAQRSSFLQSIGELRRSQEQLNNFNVEIYKKYSIPFACIIFIMIGAPLGTITRKGGMGVAAGVSVIFIFIYWAFLIGGEKLADRGMVSPLMGMWSANIFLGILGILLLVKTAKEQVTVDFSFLKKLLPKSFKSEEVSDENS